MRAWAAHEHDTETFPKKCLSFRSKIDAFADPAKEIASHETAVEKGDGNRGQQSLRAAWRRSEALAFVALSWKRFS